MKAAVRFYSRSGNTKLVADAIAEALGISAVSVDAPEAELKEKADVLFVGGALYAYGVIFSTSWISKHSIDLIRKALEAKGIPVEKETFYVKNKADEKQLKEAAAFAKKMAG